MARFVPICQSAEPPLTILLVTEIKDHVQSFTEQLSAISGGGSSLRIHTCQNVLQLVKGPNVPEADFIAFIVNHKRLNVLHDIEKSILRLDKSFMLDRICLICDNSLSCGSLIPHINALKIKYQLHVLWADIEVECKLLCTRLFNLASAVCGLASGLPVITQRAWHRRSSQTVEDMAEENMTF